MMLRLIAIFLVLPLLSCAAKNEGDACKPEKERVVVFAPSQVSVCHNPKSKEHNKTCSPDCYESGDLTAFCYELDTDICNQDWEKEKWVEEICQEIIQSL